MRLGITTALQAVTPFVSGNAGGEAAWSPGDLTGYLWYDASDTSSITEVGGAVSQWNDKGTLGKHMTQNTESEKPTSGTITINGLNAIDFDGVNDRLLNTSVSISNPYMMCAVGRLDAATANHNFFSGPTNDAGNLRLDGDDEDITFWSGASLTVPDFSFTQGNVVNVLAVASLTAGSIWIDGVKTAGDASTGDRVLGSTLYIGSRFGTANFWDGPICEMLVGPYDADVITDWNTYANSKWGIS